MKLKQVFLGSVAASGFMLTAMLADPAVFSTISTAEAATNVSVILNLNTFYDRLSPYGDWVFYQDHYVWLPGNVSYRWRPYTEGHWVYTRRYGWLWVSDERFGWATYHYGRWGYAREIGWYWVPGRRWAPAWVAWSHGDNDVAWAPLPPLYGNDNDINISISFGDIPDYYWQAVPVTAFLSFDLSGHVNRDRDHVRNIVRRGDRNTMRIENNIVVDTGIDVGFVEKRTKKKVVVLEDKPVDNPDAAGKADSKSVAIFNPEVKNESSAKPHKLRKFGEIAKERKAKGIPQLQQTGGESGTNGQPDVPVEKLKKKPADTQQNVDQQAGKKKKKDRGANTFAPDNERQNLDQSSNKKKKKNSFGDQQGSKKTFNAPDNDQIQLPGKDRKNSKVKPPASPGRNANPPCDPAVEVCPPAPQ